MKRRVMSSSSTVHMVTLKTISTLKNQRMDYVQGDIQRSLFGHVRRMDEEAHRARRLAVRLHADRRVGDPTSPGEGVEGDQDLSLIHI